MNASSAPVPCHRPRRLLGIACLLVCALLGANCGGGGGGGGTTVGGNDSGPPPSGGGGGTSPPPTGGNEIIDLTAGTGTFAGQVTLRFTAPTPAATTYEIRAQVPHVGPANASAAPLIPNGHSPSAAGNAEAITLSGLEPGQTLQFIVRPIRSGVPGGWSHGAGARVRDSGAPIAPAGAIFLSGPATLGQDNAYYRLSNHVFASGTAFTITGRNVTLDLGGFTITYGTSSLSGAIFGVHVRAPLNSGTTTVLNGTIAQSTANNTAYNDAIEIVGGHAHRITDLTLTVQQPGAHCVWVYGPPTGTIRIDHCTLNCNTTTVPNRHYPGVAAVYIEDATQSVELDHNHVTQSPQWGLKIAGVSTNGHFWVHHNRITGTKALVANGYMIGIYKPNALVFENECSGESRGIHLDGVDASGNNATVHDNYVFAQDQPNAEFNPHWCHGIKLENPDGATVIHNHITVSADASHSEARALDIDSERGAVITVYGNRISGLSSTSTELGKGLNWLGGTTAPNANRLAFTHNVIRATDQLVNRGWYAENGATFNQNAWVRDFGKVGNPFFFEVWQNMPGTVSPSHRFVDAWTSENTNSVTQGGSPGAYNVTREWTLTLLARNAANTPITGATATVRDRTGATVFSGSTDAEGIARATLVVTRITNGPSFDVRGPFQISVTGAGGTYNGSHSMSGHTALHVSLPAGTATTDSAGPSIPTGIYAVPLSASRAVVRWNASADPSGICYYLVYVNGALERITDQTEAVVSGLRPGTFFNTQVRAVDGAGLASGFSLQAVFTTPADDRGP